MKYLEWDYGAYLEEKRRKGLHWIKADEQRKNMQMEKEHYAV